jgi:NAD(P)-dependent dehydrogenase (short-subunit alcohol dehydrogenase family)
MIQDIFDSKGVHNMEIKNSAAIVTGGASGMGAATAKRLSELGAKVAILDLNLAAAKTLAQQINGIALECDVTSAESVENCVRAAEAAHGIASICINCAGIVKGRRIINQQGPMPLDEFRAVIEINLIGTFNLMRIVAAAMQKGTANSDGERGIIINTASIAAFEGQIGQCAYSASKGGIVSLTLPAARELAQFGIRVMTIAPGLVDTPMMQQIPEKMRETLIENIPFPHRLAHPEEFARLAMHIIDNPMLNGEVIRLDGALRMQPR